MVYNRAYFPCLDRYRRIIDSPILGAASERGCSCESLWVAIVAVNCFKDIILSIKRDRSLLCEYLALREYY